MKYDIFSTQQSQVFVMPPCFPSIPLPPVPSPHLSLYPSLALIPTAVTAPSPSHASAVRPGFVTGRGEAGRVRYLTARTSWLRIYADDDSRCPLAILLLPLCWSACSPNIRLIMILLWSTVTLASLQPTSSVPIRISLSLLCSGLLHLYYLDKWFCKPSSSFCHSAVLRGSHQ